MLNSPSQNAIDSLSSFDECIAFQGRFLAEVSRTFALTIPQLPPPLYLAVGNAYLLCRIADTIEDEQSLTFQQKEMYAEWFCEVVKGEKEAEEFASGLVSKISPATLEAEKELIANTEQVIQITHSFPPQQRQALERCVAIMTKGMGKFQKVAGPTGLKDISELDQYCYYVAGVVGEMLTELFCLHCPELAAKKDEMFALAINFGQGLQMTNIIKDTWDDLQRDVCWLPRDVFLRHGVDLASVHPTQANLRAGMLELVALTSHHLDGALKYVLHIPPSEKGIRLHCLSALGMAVLTIRKIHANPAFINGNDVKISRRSVRSIMFITNLLAGSNTGLKILFAILMRDLRKLEVPYLVNHR